MHFIYFYVRFSLDIIVWMILWTCVKLYLLFSNFPYNIKYFSFRSFFHHHTLYSHHCSLEGTIKAKWMNTSENCRRGVKIHMWNIKIICLTLSSSSACSFIFLLLNSCVVIHVKGHIIIKWFFWLYRLRELSWVES